MVRHQRFETELSYSIESLRDAFSRIGVGLYGRLVPHWDCRAHTLSFYDTRTGRDEIAVSGEALENALRIQYPSTVLLKTVSTETPGIVRLIYGATGPNQYLSCDTGDRRLDRVLEAAL